MTLNFDISYTLLNIILVIMIGRFLTNRSKFLRKYDIPVPVSGGIVIALIILVLTITFKFDISFNNSLKDPLMLGFFSALGLNADLKILRKAGKPLIIFLIATIGLLILQDILGIGIILLMDEDPLIGLIGGSISLTGGYGTGAAWGTVFENEPYNFEAATTTAIACATFGIIAAGLMGGPMANFLIKKYKLSCRDKKTNQLAYKKESEPDNQESRLISADSVIQSFALIMLSMFLGDTVAKLLKNASFTLPSFVWCIFFGAFFRNTLSYFKLFEVFDREIDMIGNVCLSLFLAFALMNVNLLDLADLAIPTTCVLRVC